MGDADAVVIGAGPNGLVAANLLVDAGWSVLVLEAQPTPGGAVRSDRDVHPDFVHDTMSAFYPLAAASPVIRALRLDEHGLVWRHAPAVLGHFDPRAGQWAMLHRDREVTAGLFEEQHAGDGAAWLRLCDVVGRDRRGHGRRAAVAVPAGAPHAHRARAPAQGRRARLRADAADPGDVAGTTPLRRHRARTAARGQRRARRHPAGLDRVRADGAAARDARADRGLAGAGGRGGAAHRGAGAAARVARWARCAARPRSSASTPPTTGSAAYVSRTGRGSRPRP